MTWPGNLSHFDVTFHVSAHTISLPAFLKISPLDIEFACCDKECQKSARIFLRWLVDFASRSEEGVPQFRPPLSPQENTTFLPILGGCGLGSLLSTWIDRSSIVELLLSLSLSLVLCLSFSRTHTHTLTHAVTRARAHARTQSLSPSLTELLSLIPSLSISLSLSLSLSLSAPPLSLYLSLSLSLSLSFSESHTSSFNTKG